ncbi:MAG TPA: hypothetical protein VME47_14595 [Acetobacteraceae bacterium]|nr:hypothetical protein [Acetobacteraceae bacterium]
MSDNAINLPGNGSSDGSGSVSEERYVAFCDILDFSNRMMRAESPANTDKYDWLLALHQAVENQHDLVPPNVVTKLLELKVIVRRD